MSAITILAVLKGIFMSIRYPLIGLFIIASVIFIVVFYFNYGIGGLLFASAIIGIVLATLKKFFNSYRF
ncbi:MAG: hypothetical protein NTW49_02945 [Bacteroidia bacterium]|nr:hypothetical protein [Bacteroidia bacterium]